ncbi:sigma factor G inhibitor Gin [Bacillus kwashiorkori]|uniref:sigma factor G inhibitor Gin n=1 Tax=Bacillus kwashiorkori TaxID=1522318 RepID=UPI0007823558|nr:sigma factor G inhibitor Gin [Bacillus kwashiorkori]
MKVDNKYFCIICEGEKNIGYHLYHSFICSDCEKAMINTDVSDPSYQYYLKQLKKIYAPKITI